MVPNPWQVESVQAFYFLKCPECVFDTKDKKYFQDHALENHPLSCALFGNESKEDIKENSKCQEFGEDYLMPEDHDYCENKKNPSQNFLIKEEFIVDDYDSLELSNLSLIPEDKFQDPITSSSNHEGNNLPHCETHVESTKFEIDQNKPNDPSSKSFSKKDEEMLDESVVISKAPNTKAKKEVVINAIIPTFRVNDTSTKANDMINKSLNISNEEFHQCSICTSSFQSSKRLSLHFAAVHEEKKPSKCHICAASFSEAVKLKEHFISSHEGKKPFKCPICDATFSWKGYVKQHVEMVHEKKKPFKCPICDTYYSIKGMLKKHIASVHEHKKPNLCSICGTRFSLKKNLDEHISSVHEKMKSFICSYCQTSFSRKGNLQTHIAAVHEGKREFQCSTCGDSFAQKKDLKLHTSTVHEGKKPYKCLKCDATFSQNVNLRSHVSSVHEGKKLFQCSNCDASFSRNSKLKDHIVSMHEEK